MKVFVTFKQENPAYDKEYAKKFHFGKESENNSKYLWSNGFKLQEEIKKYELLENSDFNLTGTDLHGNDFSYTIPNMTKLDCYINDTELITIAISNSLINKTHTAQNEKYNWTRFYFYFHGAADPINPIPTVFISRNDFPKDLL